MLCPTPRVAVVRPTCLLLPVTSARTAYTPSLRRRHLQPKPKTSAFSLSGGSGGGGAAGSPSAFSTYTKWPRTARAEREPEPEPARSPSRSPSPSPGGGLSLGRLSDPRRRTVPADPPPLPPATEDQVDRAASPDRPLLEKVDTAGRRAGRDVRACVVKGLKVYACLHDVAYTVFIFIFSMLSLERMMVSLRVSDN